MYIVLKIVMHSYTQYYRVEAQAQKHGWHTTCDCHLPAQGPNTPLTLHLGGETPPNPGPPGRRRRTHRGLPSTKGLLQFLP